MKISRKHLVCAGLLMVAQATLAAGGQRDADNIADLTLEELLDITVTTATRTEERAGGVPARIDVVTADQIKRRGYRSLKDVLKDLPDFKVEYGTDPDLPVDIVVQGTRGSNRIVLLLDGIRISSPTGEPLPILANYPVHAARQIEVMYGPGSALYGADAFSAVVNIISRDPGQADWFIVSSEYGQYGLSNTSGSYGVKLGGAKLLVAGQAIHDRQPDLSRFYPQDFGGLRGQRTGVFETIFGRMQPTGFVPADYTNSMSAHSFQASLNVGGWQLMLFESALQMPNAPANTPDNAIYSDEAFNLNRFVVGAGTYTRKFKGATSTSTFSMSRHELDASSGYRNTYSNMTRSYKYAYGTMAKAVQEVSWKPSPVLTMTAGGTIERFFSIPQGADLNLPVQSRDAPGTILGTDIPDTFFKLRYLNGAGYVQAQYAVAPALTLTLGARADRNSRFGGTFNPRLGVVWQSSAKSSVKLLYGSAFLAPTPFQEYSHYGSFSSLDGGATYASTFWHLPNPDLKPQKKSTTELTARQAMGDSAEMWGSAFYSRFSNLIQTGADNTQLHNGFYKGWPVDLIEVFVNQGRQQTYGGSVGLDVRRSVGLDGQVAARASISLADGYVDDGTSGRLPVGGMAPVQLHLSTDLKWNRTSVSPRLLVVGHQRLIATVAGADGTLGRRTLDGYATLDMNIRHERLFRNIDVFAAIENAFDARYRHINLRAYTNPEELVGAPQDPRRLTLGVTFHLP